jgi:hypothetical protein
MDDDFAKAEIIIHFLLSIFYHFAGRGDLRIARF